MFDKFKIGLIVFKYLLVNKSVTFFYSVSSVACAIYALWLQNPKKAMNVNILVFFFVT